MIEITLSVNTDGDDQLTYSEMKVELSKRAHQALDATLDDIFATPEIQHRTHFMTKELTVPFRMSKKELNHILVDMGWQVRRGGEWHVTNDGVEDGGAEISEGRIFWDYEAFRDMLNEAHELNESQGCNGLCESCSQNPSK